jgi:Na+-transporting NADH:ubiquinone oxidoreductase subunit D
MARLLKVFYTRAGRIIINGLWKDNPIFCMVLGICSSLAITNRLENGLAMGAGVTFVLVFSSLFVSLLRKVIPPRARMIAYMVLIATFVICVDQILKAYFPDISKSMGPYVGLIITNCIIMGRAEAFAIKNGPIYSVLDALACGIGYSMTLIILSLVRELLAFGTLAGIKVMPSGWENWVVMASAPGGFMVLAVYLWVMRSLARIQPSKTDV